MDTSNTVSRRTLVGAAGGATAAAMVGLQGAGAETAQQGGQSAAAFQSANVPTPREQTVVIEQSIVSVWDSFNPFIPNGEAYQYGVGSIAREYMFYANFLTGEIRPWLAESYEYNDDYTGLTLHLNPNVTWNDGEPFTADDVVFTHGELLPENPQFNGAAATIRDIASINATDDHTVVFELNDILPRFHYRFLAGIVADAFRVVPRHIWENEDPGTFTNNPPVYTGPYVLEETSPSLLYYLWRKNENYWNADVLQPNAEYVMYRQRSEVDAAVQEFLAGNVDIGNIDYLNQEVVAAQYDQVARFAFPDPCTRGFYFNTDSESELFSTPEGRWALSHLIDREVIATTIWQPPSRPATYPWADYDGWQPWAPDDVMDQFDLTFNVERANEILDELGATEYDGDIRVLNGQPLQLTMVTPSETTGLEYQIGSSFAATAREAGIDIDLRSLPGAAFGDAFHEGHYDISCHWICGMQFDPWQLYQAFHSRTYMPVGERTTQGDGAATRLQNPELDALIEQLDVIDVEADESKPVFDEALEAFIGQLPVVPSIQTVYPMFYNTAYWVGWPSEEDPYTIPANWWGQFMFAIANLRPAGES